MSRRWNCLVQESLLGRPSESKSSFQTIHVAAAAEKTDEVKRVHSGTDEMKDISERTQVPVGTDAKVNKN